MAERIGWGIIGCGLIARRRTVPGLLKSKQARLVGIMDIDPHNVQEAHSFGAELATSNLDELLDRKDIDAVYIASPVSLHRDHVLKAAAAGKHILCEKPMALTTEDCTEMQKACRKARVKLQIGFMMRFHPVHQKVKQLIEAGELGEPVQGRAQLSHYHVEWNPDGSRNWRQFFDQAGGGSLMDMGIHCVDLLRWWMGEVREVSAMTGTLANDYAVEDTALVLLRLKKDRLAGIDATYAVRGARHVFEVYGTQGAVLGVNTISQLAEGGLTIVRDQHEEIFQYEPIDLYTAEIEHLCHCIISGHEPMIGPADGLRNLEVCLAAYRSQKEKQAIAL